MLGVRIFRCEADGFVHPRQHGFVRFGTSRFPDMQDGIAIWCLPHWAQRQFDEAIEEACIRSAAMRSER